MSKTIRIINMVLLILLIIGGINWLSIGLFNFDIVGWIFGGQSTVGARIIFSIVGFTALYFIVYPIISKGDINIKP